jgi:hypothetical protein
MLIDYCIMKATIFYVILFKHDNLDQWSCFGTEDENIHKRASDGEINKINF